MFFGYYLPHIIKLKVVFKNEQKFLMEIIELRALEKLMC